MKGLCAVVTAALRALGVCAGCRGGGGEGGKGLVGVVLPALPEERRSRDGAALQGGLKKLGYTVGLEFSDDSAQTQARLIEDLIAVGARCLVIAPVDGEGLSDALAQAAAAKIPVIAYDRLIMKSPNVDYYVAFDDYAAGRQMGDILVTGLKLDAPAKKPVLIEVFGGSPEDGRAYKFYDGAMDRLKPYFDSGALKIGSGQQGMDLAGTLRWSGEAAAARMENLLAGYYTNQALDGILSPSDQISLSILGVCKAAGYGSAPEKPLPVAGGLGCTAGACKSILGGEQYASVLMDTRLLARAAAELVDTIMQGKTPAGLDTASCPNDSTRDGRAYAVPSALLKPVIVTRENLKKEVVDTGYRTASEAGL
ncbi:MAG: sugar-binding protein [Spirochaetaceae bacterium]|jgi:putative multiple sugar transport system substrate-binding protein|nr:sugar-binding protein [Spirochaetaceae bacterium]